MTIHGIPSYDKLKRGKLYRLVVTCDSSNSRFENKQEAQRIADEYKEKGARYIIESHGTGFLVYVYEK
jgi:hypothetical protein